MEAHAMSRLEGWGFLCLIGCAVAVALSLSLLSGIWQAVGCGVGVILGILSGGLYAASANTRSQPEVQSSARTEGQDV